MPSIDIHNHTSQAIEVEVLDVSSLASNAAGAPPLGEHLDDDMPGGFLDAEEEERGMLENFEEEYPDDTDERFPPEDFETDLDCLDQAAEEREHDNGQRMKSGTFDEDHDEWTLQEQRMLKYMLEINHLCFARYFMQKNDGMNFIVNDHHEVIADTLERVLIGEITRLIINVPPGYTKTELAVKHFIARGLAKNRRSKFIHISYADNLASLNSSGVKEIVTSEDYQQLWPQELKDDSKSKKAWYNQYGGGMMAVAAGGQITGFRAGRMMEGFSGAMIIDDPIKPDDAYSEVIRTRVNGRFTNTFKSRLAHEGVAIIVIMQRIHEEDPTGYLLSGGSGDFWHHLVLPVEILPEEEREEYPKEYTHGIPIPYDLPPGPLWEYKHNIDQIAVLKTDPYTAAAQYYQRPSPMGGGLFKDEWWQFYEVDPNVEFKIITGDTAQKTDEHNDYSVFQCWGYLDGNIYLLDQIRGKWEAPQLRDQFRSFWVKHFGNGLQVRGRLREAYIEDKSSGTGLIQDIAQEKDIVIPIFPIQRNKDKVSRSMDGIPYIASKRVYLNKNADYLSDYQSEFRKFTPLMTHKNDDQIDPTLDAILILLGQAGNHAGTW